MALTTKTNISDDEETWKILIALKPGDADLTDRLDGLKQRLLEDFCHDAGNAYWGDLTKRLVSLGFHYSSQPMKQEAAGNNSNPEDSDFASDLGKQHIQATCALLKLDEKRAIQVSRGTLQKIYKDESELQSLLGSKDFLMKTALYHFQQRSARLSVLTECLRLEQDPDSVQQPVLANFLDSLDSIYSDGSRNRGLFRRLVTIACMPEITPTREQLEPSKKMQSARALRSLQDSMLSQPKDTNVNLFGSEFLEETRSQTIRERNEAMEALLVLLYHRINAGTRRPDLALLLIAFQTSFGFFTNLPKSQRLSKLAGLICAESMGLWRAFEADIDPRVGWATKHPLLLGVVPSGMVDTTTQTEIESLKNILFDCANAATSRKTQGDDTEAPEALALLSFGLLLCLAHDSISTSDAVTDTTAYWGSFKTNGTEIASSANDRAGAFDYLFSLVNDLASNNNGSKSSAVHGHFYDWQLSNKKSSPLLIANGQEDAAADIIAYTSIAREVLAAAIAAFETTLLAIDNENSCENIGVLCNLAASIYQNNPLLSQEFWDSWASYVSSSDPPVVALPVCSLMEAAHKLAVRALDALKSKSISDEVFLPAVSPFFCLLSSLCHESHIVETTTSILPDGMVRSALLACRLPLAVTGSDSYCKSRTIFLNAFGKLAKVADSESCLDSLRLSLEDASHKHIVDGPRVLGRILSYSKEAAHARPVLQIMAHLLDGAPQRWALELARQFIFPQEQESSILATFLIPGMGTEHAAALVLAELVEHLTAVVFCKSFNDNDAVVFLHVVTDGILSAGATLASSLSTATASMTVNTPVVFETAQTILQLFTNFLKLIRTVIELHHSPQVSATSVEVRDSLINALASSAGLAQAISYYAAAPVSLSLSIKLENALADESLSQSLSGDGNKSKKYGAWQSVLSNQSGSASIASHGKMLLLESVASMTVEDFDLQGIQDRGWTGGNDQITPLNTAWSAIRLLSMWALHVEDIVKSHLEDTSTQAQSSVVNLVARLSPQRLLSSLASSPVPCRSNSLLPAVWESAGLSNFEMLLPYLAYGQDSKLAAAVPSSVTLDFLHTCLSHVKYIYPTETAADTVLFSGVYRSLRFSKLLIDSIDRAVDLSSKVGLVPQEKTDLINGLLSLRLLCACVEVSPAVADKMLRLDSNSFVTTLIKAATKAKDLLDVGQDGSKQIFVTEEEIVQMRIATGAVSVLSSLWTVARSTIPGQAGSAAARLVDVVDSQTEFITTLVTVVMSYANANDIESNIVPSRESEYARCTLTSFMAKALDILATEVAYFVCNSERSTNATLENFLLKTFFQPQRFTSFNGYRYAAESTAQFAESEFSSIGNLTHPISLLRCFQATSSTYLSQDFYTNENAFDVGLSAHWFAENYGKNEEEIEEIMARVAIAYQLASCDLKMISSWKGFAEVLVYFSVEHSSRTGNKNGEPNAKRLLELAQDTLQALHFNIQAINQAQVEVAEDFMRKKSTFMAKLLTELFLFFLEMGSASEESAQLLAYDELIDLLDLLTKTSELLFTVISTLPANATTTADLEICCTLERPLLASSILINNLIEAKAEFKAGTKKGREKIIYNSLCRVNSKVLQVLGEVIKANNKKNDVSTKEKRENRESLRCCISLFTVLVAKGQGSQISDASYFKLISETLREYDVLKQLIEHGMTASREAANSILSSFSSQSKDYWRRGPSLQEEENLVVVQSVLNLLYSVAEANDPEMLSILPGAQLGHFVARNPLFEYAAHVWKDHDASNMRGYVVSDERNEITLQSKKMAPNSLPMGKDDPVHAIWLTSMKVLQASLRSSSNCLNIQGTESIGKQFFAMSVEFLVIYRNPLISCLKCCDSELTRNELLEATQVLALIAELCKRDTRDLFLHTQRDLCEELVKWSKFVVASISKFLGASGTARELFHALEQYESAPELVENGNNQGSIPSTVKHPLLSGRGLQSAKHEAYKFSHFAAMCCQRITKLDFEAYFTVPTNLKQISQNREHYSDLERFCRMSVTGNFALQMEKAAADCLSQAISFIWKTHPLSQSFKMFSEKEILQLHAMELVQPGMIIGYRPAGGDGILGDGGVETFEGLRFGRVISSDTINRSWNVKVLRQDSGQLIGESIGSGSEQELVEVVRMRQLAGIEEVAMRKTVVKYVPAPDTMDALKTARVDLSLGHLILVLRWCHQRAMLGGRLNQTKGSIQRIAEQTIALLGAELAIHDENGSSLNKSKTEIGQLDAQVFEMFADPDHLKTLDFAMEDGVVPPVQEGRLKNVVGAPAWQVIRPQVSPYIERTWKVINEKEKRRREKRAYSDDSNWFSGRSLQSKGYKSAFRG